jgi:TPR repeat protein
MRFHSGRAAVMIAMAAAALTAGMPAGAQAPKQPEPPAPKPAPVADDIKPAFDALKAKDYAKAERILKPMVARGDLRAKFLLGAEVYGFNGSSLHSLEKAIPLLKDAAEHGFPPAMAYYGAALADGAGVTKDKVEAYKFIALASRHKVPDTEVVLARLASEMSDDELERAKQAADAFVPRK